MDSKKRTILITGGSRGIGAATARLAGARGWNVVLSYAGNASAAEQTVIDVRSAGGAAVAVRANAAVEVETANLFDEAARTFGYVDALFNNAGIMPGPEAPLGDISVERLRHVVEVNFIGAYLAAREAVRRMAISRGGRGGVIVNMSSAAARHGSANAYVDYAGTKGAIDVLTVGLAREVGADGIRVVSVRPGLIETDIHTASGNPDRVQQIGGTVPLGRAGTAAEVAEAVLWLVSDAASYVHGATLDVTGGR